MPRLLEGCPQQSSVLADAVLHVDFLGLVPGESRHQAALLRQHPALLALLPEGPIVVVSLPAAAPKEEAAGRHSSPWAAHSCVLQVTLTQPASSVAGAQTDALIYMCD